MKENKIEKLILNLSTKWGVSPEEVVDRLNNMSNSALNELVKEMIKKFYAGGPLGSWGFYEKRLPNGTYYTIDKTSNETNEKVALPDGRVFYRTVTPYYTSPDGPILDTTVVVGGPRRNIYESNEIKITSPHSSYDSDGVVVSPAQWRKINSSVDKTKTEALSYKTGGLMDCLRSGGNLSECKKCGGKTPIKARGGEKVPRTDGVSGYAYKKDDGSLVLTRDGSGPVPLPGSSYQMPGYEPPMSTVMRIETDKGGKPIRYEVDVYNDGGDNLFPVNKYSSDSKWYQPFRRNLTEEALQRYIDAFKANGLLRKGGKMKCKK